MEVLSDGTVRIFNTDEESVDAEGHRKKIAVFEGTVEEAEALKNRAGAGLGCSCSPV